MVIGIQGILFLFSILLSSFSVSFSFSAVGSEVRKSLFCNTNQYEGFLTPFSDTAAHTSRTDHSRISMKVSSGLKSDSIVYTSKAFQIRYANRDDFNKGKHYITSHHITSHYFDRFIFIAHILLYRLSTCHLSSLHLYFTISLMTYLFMISVLIAFLSIPFLSLFYQWHTS